MKPLTYILLLIPFLNYGQASNAPEIVFPIVEQFIAEAHAADVRVYHKIREIDSIQTVLLNYPITGMHVQEGNNHFIFLHKNRAGRALEKTFHHEVGHVFELEHSDNPHDIMFSGTYSEWFEDNDNWQRAKDEFFKQLKFLSQ